MTEEGYKSATTTEQLEPLWFKFYRENKDDLNLLDEQEKWGQEGFKQRFMSYAKELSEIDENRKERLKKAIIEVTLQNYKSATTAEQIKQLWVPFFEANQSDLEQENWGEVGFQKRFMHYEKQVNKKNKNPSESGNQELEKEAKPNNKRKNPEDLEAEPSPSTKKRDTKEKETANT